ncbi:amidohydrolase family protein [Herbiconiux flava]|uniref:Cytosine/adenosine deaminase-related metal-dependent hydrolase n=1 Tax=Herbiconiux flava TaxID=881268 RepID=A0A852SMM9_9MICO|nr:amidohydrolase family protein [Herbiconiux flava]NYD70071.1 cytosine/adenosine deaminase-related metal-dependent hydrolase [Herbiconiux flava]GLK16821.1 8-oxoguanine deaminase [Herbiconiux flava]
MSEASTLLTIVNAVVIPLADGPVLGGAATGGAGGAAAGAGGTGWFRGWLAVGADGRIEAMGEGALPPERESIGSGEVLDAKGAFLAPGFVSAHSHIFTSGMRGMTPGEPLYGWVGEQSTFIAGADEEDVYWFTLHGCLDFLGNGVTSAYNFTDSRVVGKYDAETDRREIYAIRPEGYLHRQFDAARDAGLRTMNAIRLDSEFQPAEEAFDAFGRAVRYLEASVPAELSLGASVFGAVQWSASAQAARDEVRAMDEHGIGNQAHFLETSEALDQQREKFRWYEEAGALRPGFLFGHFVHPDTYMARVAAQKGAGMVWQPTSNGRLGSGVADIPRYRELGMPIGVGLDDQSCTDVSDPFQNVRIGVYTQRAVNQDASVLMPRDMLRMHTLGSAEALGVADRVGSLEVGKFADLLLVDPSSPDTGPVWDVHAHYAFACGLRNLKRVYVGGQLVSEDGVSTNPLAARASAELHSRVREVAARSVSRSTERLAW